jgi:hypothetical protein
MMAKPRFSVPSSASVLDEINSRGRDSADVDPSPNLDLQRKAEVVVIDQEGQQQTPVPSRESALLSLSDLPEPLEVKDREGDLDNEETAMLAQCRRALDQFAQAEAVAIKAMLVIRNRRLYRQTHATFEDFAQEVYERQRRWVNRQISRYLVTDALGLDPMGSKLLPERQARELTALLPQGADAVRAVWEEATSIQGEPTAEILRQVRERRYPQARRKSNQAPSNPAAALVKRLGANPPEIAATLRAGLSEDDFAALVALLASEA